MHYCWDVDNNLLQSVYTLIKLFRSYDNVIIDICMSSFGLATVSELVGQRKR